MSYVPKLSMMHILSHPNSVLDPSNLDTRDGGTTCQPTDTQNIGTLSMFIQFFILLLNQLLGL